MLGMKPRSVKKPHLIDEESKAQRMRANGKYSIGEARSPGSLIHEPVINMFITQMKVVS